MRTPSRVCQSSVRCEVMEVTSVNACAQPPYSLGVRMRRVGTSSAVSRLVGAEGKARPAVAVLFPFGAGGRLGDGGFRSLGARGGGGGALPKRLMRALASGDRLNDCGADTPMF